VGLPAPIRDYVETLVHPSARQDVLTAARHRAFIAPRLLGSVAALASFPIYLIVRGAPSAIELIVFGWLVVPILIAYFLSRTGRYASAHVLSALALTGLVTVVAIWTGGIASFVAIWLVVVPLEAALSASRRVVAVASTFALGATGLLLLAGEIDLLPASGPGGFAPLAALGIVSAALYAAGLALGAETLARTSFWLFYAEEDRYRLLARNMADVIVRYGPDGAVLFVSPAAETLFGCSLGELHVDGLFDRVHVTDRPAYLSALGDAAALRQSRSIEFRVRREELDPSGVVTVRIAWIEMRCRPLEEAKAASAARGRCAVVAVLRDVTARKGQEQALEDARGEAERASAAKSRFIATMSHELRTPLNAIIGFSSMLMKESQLPLDAASRSEYAGLINESGNHLLAIINGMLDISKIETDNFEIIPERCEPGQILAACCDLLALQARDAGVALDRAPVIDLPDVIADRRALTQILLNLVSNAIRFTDRDGKVTIGARADAGNISFVIEDNGLGINEKDLARVGEPYFQAHASYDRRHGGTGLGLSIVKGLVRLHGGEVKISSRVGEGTRVVVCLPLDCGHAQSKQRSRTGGDVKHLWPARAATAPAHRPYSTAGESLVAPLDIRVKKSA
jgi:two-component system, cell cycle sensor histidine kinase DivJ